MNRLRTKLGATVRDEGGFTLPEMLMTIVISSIIVGVIAAAMIVGLRTTSSTETRINESHDAQMASAYFVADANNATSFNSAVGTCAAGVTSIAHFQWIAAGATNDVYYGTKGTPATFVRRACVNNANPVDVSLVKHLGATPTVTCPAPDTMPCSSTPKDVELNVQETTGYTFALRASPRPKSGSTPIVTGPKVAVYVGSGGMTLKGNSTIANTTGQLVAVNGDVNACSGSGINVSEPFFVDGTIDKSCPGGTVAQVPADPLRNLLEPAVPPVTDPPASNANDCGSNMKTYRPGHYTAAVSFTNGCMASGIYYFDLGGSLTNIQSATAGVHIYVPPPATAATTAAHDLSLDTVTLWPLPTGDQANVTIFLGRKNTGVINTFSSMTVHGVIYAPAGELDLQSANSNLTVGGVDVNSLQFKGNGDQITLG